MIGWNETGYTESDFLPPAGRESHDTHINGVPHEKRQCDPMYVCAYHGDPEKGT